MWGSQLFFILKTAAGCDPHTGVTLPFYGDTKMFYLKDSCALHVGVTNPFSIVKALNRNRGRFWVLNGYH